jgi:hypothetical protein
MNEISIENLICNHSIRLFPISSLSITSTLCFPLHRNQLQQAARECLKPAKLVVNTNRVIIATVLQINHSVHEFSNKYAKSCELPRLLQECV